MHAEFVTSLLLKTNNKWIYLNPYDSNRKVVLVGLILFMISMERDNQKC